MEIPLLGKALSCGSAILVPWNSLLDNNGNKDDDVASDFTLKEQWAAGDLLKLQLFGKTEIFCRWRLWCHDENRLVLLRTSAMKVLLFTLKSSAKTIKFQFPFPRTKQKPENGNENILPCAWRNKKRKELKKIQVRKLQSWFSERETKTKKEDKKLNANL